MALSILLLVGLATAVFVGVNIGGSSTGVAFGPATGSDVLTMRQASALMAIFVVLGGATVGTNVIETLGSEFVEPRHFTLGASIGVLLFTGLGILLGNALKVSVSTSETAVGAVVGMGAALGVLDWRVVGIVVSWWFVSAVIAFWVSAVVGRYLYARIVGALDFDSGRRGAVGKGLLIAIGCYMAFSAGASNVANAVAPLVGSGQLSMTGGVAVGGIAIGIGAFVLGPRTMETIGEGVTELSMESALIVEVIAATIITGLSLGGIPASLAITATMCIIGLGWGRASRRASLADSIDPRRESEVVANGDGGPKVADLYDPQINKRIISAWFATPTLAGVLAFIVFEAAIGLQLL